MEGCRRLPSGRVNTNNSKRMIVKFVNRKHSEVMFCLKTSRSNVYITNSLCLYYRFLWGKCEKLHRKGLINQVFCLRAVVTIKVRESCPPIKILYESDLLVHQEVSEVVLENQICSCPISLGNFRQILLFFFRRCPKYTNKKNLPTEKHYQTVSFLSISLVHLLQEILILSSNYAVKTDEDAAIQWDIYQFWVHLSLTNWG